MAGKFSIDLSRIIGKAQGKAETVARQVMFQAFSGVVNMAPVDTGRFRANFIVGYGTPNTATTAETDKTGSATIGRISAAVSGARFGDGSIFLTNSLPYSIRLENGYSQKAPAGMVAVTLARISSRYGA